MAKTSVFTVRAATRNEVYDSLIKTCRAVAQEEASHQNLSNQALMGAKEGNLHLHLRPRVTDPRNPDGDEKGMDEHLTRMQSSMLQIAHQQVMTRIINHQEDVKLPNRSSRRSFVSALIWGTCLWNLYLLRK